MDFSNEDDQALIYLVSGNPALFNTSAEEYKNILLKDSLWDDIAKELNKNSEACRKRWKNIRDSYNRFNKQHKPGSRIPKNSKWKIYELLGFLDNGANSKTERPQTELVVVEEEEIIEPKIENNAIEINEEETSNESSTIAQLKNEVKVPKTKRRRRNKKGDNLHLNYNQNLNRAPHGDVGSFCKHVEDVLNSLPPVYKIRAKQEIFNIVTNYEILAAEHYEESMRGQSN